MNTLLGKCESKWRACHDCSYDRDEIDQQFREANEFFAPIALSEAAPARGFSAGEDPLRPGKNGMPAIVTIPFYSQTTGWATETSDDLKKLIDEQLDNIKLIGMVGTAMADAECTRQKNRDLMWSPDLWKGIIAKYPLKIFRSSSTPSFNKKAKTLELTKSIVTEVLDVVNSEMTGDGLKKFQAFLEGLLNNIKIGVEVVKETYATTSVDYLCEPDPKYKDRVYPRIQANFATFSKTTKTISVACGTEKEYEVDFNYERLTYEFNYRSLSKPIYQKQFDDFLAGHDKLDASSSSAYFDGKKAQ